MPEPKHPLKVFLCHAHADRDPVRGLYARLTQDGVDAWLDKAKLLPGQDWELEIRKAVREADVVVVCLSKQFNQAGFRQKEVRLALDTAMEKPEGEIFIIPARLEECDNLESLRKWHWVDLFEDDGYEMLIRALRTRANKIGATLQTKKSRLSIINTQSVSASQTAKPVEKNKRSQKFKLPFSGTALLVILIMALTFGLPSLIGKPEDPILTATNTVSAKTPTLTITSTKIVPITTTALLTEITDEKGVKMVLVPTGEFIMGTDDGGYYDEDSKPAHKVYLDAFYIDKYEVTNLSYKLCVEAGWCEPPNSQQKSSSTRSWYYDNPEYDNYPVLAANWDGANVYCEWRGAFDKAGHARLPSEAEWEKAARGADGRTYPWGENISHNEAQYCSTKISSEYWDSNCSDTKVVDSYESGRSPYGVYNMTGNIREFVFDWYSDTYYKNSPYSNPLGPNTGQCRVIRGGSWKSYTSLVNDLTTYSRSCYNPSWDSEPVGFRCVRSVP